MKARYTCVCCCWIVLGTRFQGYYAHVDWLPIYLQGQAVALLALRNPEDEGASFYQSTPCIAPEILSSTAAL